MNWAFWLILCFGEWNHESKILVPILGSPMSMQPSCYSPPQANLYHKWACFLARILYKEQSSNRINIRLYGQNQTVEHPPVPTSRIRNWFHLNLVCAHAYLLNSYGNNAVFAIVHQRQPPLATDWPRRPYPAPSTKSIVFTLGMCTCLMTSYMNMYNISR